MRKGMKAILFAGAAVGLTLGATMVSFAGTWKTGEGADQNKWWYDFDNGTYAKNGWQWIDGNNDGIAEYKLQDPLLFWDPAFYFLCQNNSLDLTINGKNAYEFLTGVFFRGFSKRKLHILKEKMRRYVCA